MSELDRASEARRQREAKDSDFKQPGVCFFEIVVFGDNRSVRSSYLIPMAIPPRMSETEDEFAIDEAVGADGGLHVEENGVVRRRIRLEGDMGFRPKPANPWATTYGGPRPSDPSFAPRLSGASDLNHSLSGQRHFQYLQDSLRMYGDLKRDPETAGRIELRYHNQRDRQHWRVHLVRFSERQDERSRISSPHYVIELLVSGQVDEKTIAIDSAQDGGFLGSIKNVVETIQSGVNLIRSAVQKVLGYVDDVRKVVAGIDSLISSVASIADDAADVIGSTANVVDGVASLDDRVKARYRAAVERARSALVSLESAIVSLIGSDAPASVSGDLDTISDGLCYLVVHEASFDPAIGQVSLQLQVSDLDKSLDEDLVGAQADGSFEALRGAGSGPRVGDSVLAGGSRLGLFTRPYRSASEYVVEQGDTLETIATKLIGDAAAWRDIAILNNLDHPFTSTAGIPNTAGPGVRLLIPSLRRAASVEPTHGVVGVRSGSSAEERLLGADFALVPSADDLSRYDWMVDTSKGSGDAMLVRGVANLSQALQSRVRTEQGDLPGYPAFGRARDAKSGRPDLDREMQRLRIAQAVLADPRIVSVDSLDVPEETDSPDVMRVEIVATIRGLDRAQTFSPDLGG